MIDNIAEDATVRIGFNTRAGGVPITLAGSPAVAVYKDGGTTEITAGVTLSVDFDSRVGYHVAVIDTSADAAYTVGSLYEVVLTAGTVDGESQVGTLLGSFRITAATFTTADRTALLIAQQQATDAKVAAENALVWVEHEDYGLQTLSNTLATKASQTSVNLLPSAAAVRDELDANSTKLAGILEDTGTTLPAVIGGIETGDPSDWNTVKQTVAKLDNTLEDSGGYRFKEHALGQAPSGDATVDDAAAVKIAAQVVAQRGEYYPPRALVWVLHRGGDGIVVRDGHVISKGASEEVKCWIDFAALLGRNEAINSLETLTVAGSTFTKAADSGGVLGNLVYLVVEGGESGQAGTVSCEVTTTADQTLACEVQVCVPY